MLYMSLAVCSLVVGAAMCAPEHVQGDHDRGHVAEHSAETANMRDQPTAHVAPLAKRSPHYNFGLGKRAYSYVSEYKRLPVYNFGLGKRMRPYDFGLGKRSIDEDAITDDDTNEVDQEALADILDQYDDNTALEKRARPYSFGLGKRYTEEDGNEEKRTRMYDFGLGKRVPLYNFGLGKRARSYSFGLGKRLSKFNFGLGKRERDLHRYGFGLGKRSSDDLAFEDNRDNGDS